MVKPKRNFLPPSVEVIFGDIELIDPDKSRIKLSGPSGKTISYDYMVVSTGSHIHPEEIAGMKDGGGWQRLLAF